MALDLSKLTALELPSKEIELNILGEIQTVKVCALDDESSLKIISISADDTISDGDKQIIIRRLVLEKAVLPSLSSDEINLLMTKAAASVLSIYIAVSELTKEFAEARQNVSDEAKKNLNKTQVTGTQD